LIHHSLFNLFVSGHDELIHRTLVMITNLASVGGAKMVQHLFEGGVVLALTVVIESCKGERIK